MKTIFHLRPLNVLLLAVLVALTLNAQTRPSLAEQAPIDSLTAREVRQNWMQAELTLDNSSYAATRAQIDKLIHQGEKPEVLEIRYRLEGNDRDNPQKIFRWAYAAYRKQKLAPKPTGLMGIDEAMDRNLRPGAYDWVRLRFLVASLQTFLRPTMELISVGRRLLKIKHNDEEVMFHFVRNLQDSQILEDRKQAVVLSKRTASLFPKDFYWQWAVAYSVTAANDFAGRPTYAGNQISIAEFKKTLQMLPPEHPFRRRLIGIIVRLDLDFDSKGNPVKWTRKQYKEALQSTTLR